MSGWDTVLAELVHERGAALKRYGYLLCGDGAEAEDLLQDALVRTFTSSRRSEVNQVEQYVRKVMLNLYLDRARRRSIWQRILPLAAPRPPDRDQHARVDLRDDLRRALLTLSARQRACVVLHYYLDLSVPECAETLDLSTGATKRYLHEARRRLAEHLSSSDHVTENGHAAP